MIHRILTYFKKKKFLRRCRRNGIDIVAPVAINNLSLLKVASPCYIGPDSWLSLRAELEIGCGTVIGPRLKVHTSNHRWDGDMLPYDDVYLAKKVVIGENVWIGADVTIMPGVRIGEGAIVAACSCVTKDVAPFALVAGVPAEVKKYRDKGKYQKLKEDGKIYLRLKHDGLISSNEQQRIVMEK